MKTVILLSGGIDSNTLLHECVQLHGKENVRALTFDYGQRARKELSFAYLNATKLGVPLKQVDLVSLGQILSSSLTGSVAVPEGADKKNTVPNRNMILLSIGMGHAIALGFHYVAYAAHKGGFDKDTHPEFIAAMDKVAHLCDWKPLSVYCPYIEVSKAGIVKKGHALGMDYSQTWSCYLGQDRHCGRCGACCDRIRAFKEAGVADRTSYVDPYYALTYETEKESP